jgi:hypothetical protein
LSSSWWWPSRLVSAGVLFFDLFCGGIMSCFSAETRWAPMLGDVRKSGRDAQTQKCRNSEHTNVQVWNTIHERRDKESQKDCSHLKSCESLYTCPHSLFIGRRRDFYIPKIPSNLRNIPSVNMYMNVLYIPWFAGLISYIHKPATSSHIKPGLLR